MVAHKSVGGYLLPLLIAVTATACGGTEPAPAATPPQAPATVEARVTEGSLTSITLTVQAEERLGIVTVEVEETSVPRTRSLGGVVMAPGGSETTMTAPFAGTLEAAASATVGAAVAAGAPVFRIVPLAAADRNARIEAERAVSEAEGLRDMAAKRATRAATLADDGSGSQRAAEEAAADLVVADATLKAARERFSLAAAGVDGSGAVVLSAPYAGVLRALHAGSGQTVAAGAPLFELVTLDTVWIRVPVYAGQMATIDRRASAAVVELGTADSAAGVSAQPVAAPPSADATSATVDLYYALSNSDGAWRPGQRVGVRLTQAAEARSLVVPYGALLHDATGGTWVYEAMGNQVYVRRRVSVADIVGSVAVLSAGPAPGTRVVTLGAAELFGTEFGVGK